MKLIIITLFLTSLYSQEHRSHDHPDEFTMPKGHNREKMENMMVWKLTDRLELTTEQAEKFFPEFRIHRNKHRSIMDKKMQIGEKIAKDIKKNKKMTTSEVNKIIEEDFDLEKEKNESRKDFLLKMGKVLTPNQIALLSVFKHNMIKEMEGDYKKHKKRSKKEKRNKKRMKSRF